MRFITRLNKRVKQNRNYMGATAKNLTFIIALMSLSFVFSTVKFLPNFLALVSGSTQSIIRFLFPKESQITLEPYVD